MWYDNRADDLTKEGMLKGIEEAAAFLLFLSTGVLERPYCQMEIRHALALKKSIVLVHGERDAHASGLLTDAFGLQKQTPASAPSTYVPPTPQRPPTCSSCSTARRAW